MRRIALASLALILAVGASASETDRSPDRREIGACAGTPLCGLHRPEDVSAIAQSGWFAISQADRGNLVLYRPATGDRETLDLNSAPPAATALPIAHRECTPRPDPIAMRGIDAREVQGANVLAVINVADGTRIELFTVTLGAASQVQWAGCIPVPSHYQLNDVAISPTGQIFATHMFDLPGTEEGFTRLTAKFANGEETGYAIHYDRQSGWHKVAGSDVSFANGIAISQDGETLAVAGTYSEAVTLIALNKQSAPRRLQVALHPDNIAPLGTSNFSVAGHTGIPITGIAHCREQPEQPCAFPFAIAEITVEQTGTHAAATVYCHERAAIAGASVAVRWRGGYLLGTSFGDRISYVKRAEPSPTSGCS